MSIVYIIIYTHVYTVAGCTNSDPLFSTEDCHFAGHTHLTLHGLHFHLLCPEVTPPTDHARFPTGRCTSHVRTRYTVYVGTVLCRDVTVVSQFMLSCTLERGAGKNLDVVVYRNMEERVREGEGEGEREREVVMILKDVVSFKEIIDFREKFNRFAELGVGGLKKEIDELYRRAFASRGTYPPLSLSPTSELVLVCVYVCSVYIRCISGGIGKNGNNSR